MVQYSEQKDHNQIRNLALQVADPAAIRVPKTPNPKGTGFFCFVEMETQEQAKELLQVISKDVDGYKAFWAREPNISGEKERDGMKIINDWGNKTKVGFGIIFAHFSVQCGNLFENL